MAGLEEERIKWYIYIFIYIDINVTLILHKKKKKFGLLNIYFFRATKIGLGLGNPNLGAGLVCHAGSLDEYTLD